jgi:hypothetical protein
MDLLDRDIPGWLLPPLLGAILLGASALVMTGSPRDVARQRVPDPRSATGSPECLQQWKAYAAAGLVSASDAADVRPTFECRGGDGGAAVSR